MTEQKEATRRITESLDTEISNFAKYHDGFSFTVATELEAYKAAHKYQGVTWTTVAEAPNVNAWLVQIYS